LLEREAARVLLRVDEAEAVGDVQVVDAQLLEPPPVLQGLSQTVAEPVVPQRPDRGQAEVERQVVVVPGRDPDLEHHCPVKSRIMATGYNKGYRQFRCFDPKVP